MIIKYAELFLLAGALFLLSGCVDLTLHSAWREHEILIDGKDADWQQILVKEKNVAFGAFNDDENLYLCFSITDKMTKAQLMGLFKQDFYIWLSTESGRSRTFGLKFTNDSAFMKEALLSKTRYLQVQAFQVIADEMMSHLKIQVVRNYYPVASLAEAQGIDSSIGVAKNGRELVYELKVPLQKSARHPYAVGSAEGKPVYVGLETSPLNLIMMRKQLGLDEFNEMDNAAVRERMGGRAGMERSMTADRRTNFETEIALENFRPVQVWCRVILAKRS